ncbi:hypothetical protein [Amycolatopsis pithecellobii]|uniref:Uncharacterized protein n=1 Tax=Amycolatopsis pithecellobii TaxID=664692 RepID=A0A6N7Z4I1_9PSEU|nr:hypothetical protein [Amycolatopsis pithecellobii]MTD55210.1 hypothetical protein [Amycolatopsis pithecellobii]
MTEPVYLADCFALRQMGQCVRPEARPTLWSSLTDAVEDSRLGFPREVATELGVLARDEQVTSWASGLGANLRKFSADIKFNRPLMKIVETMGYQEGFDSLDGKEPAIAHLARLAISYSKTGTPFILATEDFGEGPLSPTMEQICEYQNWAYVDAMACLKGLGLGDLIAH